MARARFGGANAHSCSGDGERDRLVICERNWRLSHQLSTVPPHGTHGWRVCLRDQAPADRNDWRELKRHIVRMKTTLNLVHTTLREERGHGISLTAEIARKLVSYARWGLCYFVADPKKSSCQDVGSP